MKKLDLEHPIQNHDLSVFPFQVGHIFLSVISTDENFSRCGSIPANGLQLAISSDSCKISEAKQHFIVFQVPRKAKVKFFAIIHKD